MPSRYKKIIIGALLFLLSSLAHGQLMSDGRFARLMFRDSFEFQTNWLNSFSLDTSLSGATIQQFAPVKTVKDYIDNHIRSSSYFSDRGVRLFTDISGAKIFRIQDTLDDVHPQPKFLWNYDLQAFYVGYDKYGIWTSDKIVPNTTAIGNSLVVNASGGVALGNFNTGYATSPLRSAADSVLFQLGNGTESHGAVTTSDALTIFRSGTIQSKYYSNGDPTLFLTSDASGNFVLATPSSGVSYTGSNFANADLTATGERTHNFAHNGMLIGNLNYLDMVAMGTDGTVSSGDTWSATNFSQVYIDTTRTTLGNQSTGLSSAYVSLHDSTVELQVQGVGYTPTEYLTITPDKFLFHGSAAVTKIVVNNIPDISPIPGYIAVFDGDTLKKSLSSSITSSARPYKVWTGLVSQSGTSAPTAIELENTFGSPMVFDYFAEGHYDCHLASSAPVFIASKLFTSVGDMQSGLGPVPSYIRVTYSGSAPLLNIFTETTSGGATVLNGLLNNTPIEIRVYP